MKSVAIPCLHSMRRGYPIEDGAHIAISKYMRRSYPIEDGAHITISKYMLQ